MVVVFPAANTGKGYHLRELRALELQKPLAVDEVVLEGFAVLSDPGVGHDELSDLLERTGILPARRRHTGKRSQRWAKEPERHGRGHAFGSRRPVCGRSSRRRGQEHSTFSAGI